MPKTIAKESSVVELKRATMKNITVLMTTAFGLVAALAWNAAIQAVFADVFGTQTQIAAMIGYAVLVTLIAVVVIFISAG